MTTQTIDIADVQVHFMELLQQVVKGDHIILSKNKTPVAQMVPISKRVAGLHVGEISTSDDFDEPLPNEFWMGEK